MKLEQAARPSQQAVAAMQLALEALVDHGTAYLHHEIHYSEAITALREALAEQAEREPVADQYNGDDGHPFDHEFHAQLLAGAHLLTEDGQEIFNMGWNAAKEFFAAPIEPVKQEPVAWVSEDVCDGQFINGRKRRIWWECIEGAGTPFYAAPVRTKDLTDDEISDAIHGKGSPLRLHDYAIRDFRAVIAADREKNK